MKSRIRLACLFSLAAMAFAPANAQDQESEQEQARERVPPVVEIRPDRIILLDADRAGERIVAVGERGMAALSDDNGQSWRFVVMPTTRTLTAVAFADDGSTGVAVGHGGTAMRTDDAGETWQATPIEEAGIDSLLGATSLGGNHLIVYGAFGMYFDSTDAGRTWTRHTVMTDDFERHISQVIQVDDKLFMVAESGILARSDDMGQTWTKLESPYEGSFFGATRAADGSVLAFGMRGNVFRSSNLATAELVIPETEEPDTEDPDYDEYAIIEPPGAQGVNWRQIPLDTTASLMGGAVLDDGRVLLVGNVGLLAVSEDNGQTLHLRWEPENGGMSRVMEVDGRLLTVGIRGIQEIQPASLAAE